MNLKRRIYEIMEIADKKDLPGVLFNFFLLVSIASNILISGLYTIYGSDGHPLLNGFYQPFYLVSIAAYAVEYVLRTWTCVVDIRYARPVLGRLQFLCSPLMLVDGLVIASFLLFGPGINIIFMRALRLFNLSSYIGNNSDYSPYLLMRKSVINRKEELIITLLGSLVTLVICSYLIFFIEKSAQPQALDSIKPSLKWAFGVLTNNSPDGFQPITQLGKILHIIMTLVGVLIIGLPLGIITGGFISEIGDAKKNMTLRNYRETIKKALSRDSKIKVRSLTEQLGISPVARSIDLDMISAKLQFAPAEIFEIIRSSRELRIRACKTSRDSHYEDNLIIEHFPSNTEYGMHINRKSGIHVIATQNYSDAGIGHYSRLLAEMISASYYSNEFFSSGDLLPEKRINFSKNPDYLIERKDMPAPFKAWKSDLFGQIGKDDLVIYLGTAGGQHPADAHVLCGGMKGDYEYTTMPESTYTDLDELSNFQRRLGEAWAVKGVLTARHEHFNNSEKEHCSWFLRKNKGADVLTLYMNVDFLQFTDPNTYYLSLRILADELLKLNEMRSKKSKEVS